MSPWAGQLLFVNWSKIEALFSSRFSGDNASGKSYEVRDKVPTPKVKENFPVCTCAGRLLGGSKREGVQPHIKCEHAPTGLYGGESIVTKSCTCIPGKVLGPQV